MPSMYLAVDLSRPVCSIRSLTFASQFHKRSHVSGDEAVYIDANLIEHSEGK